jgi:predicted Zn-dependent peptidase
MTSIVTLHNGLRIIGERVPHSSSAALEVWVGVGSRYESEADHGIAHFIEHMAFKGTEKRRSSFAIANEIERVGGDLNAETCKEFTGYAVKVPSRHCLMALDVLVDMISRPLLRSEDILSERQVVLEELSTYKDSPSDYVFDLLSELMWRGQALGRSELGSKETISVLERENLCTFMKHYYTPRNIVISCAGNVEPEVIAGWIEKHFSIADGGSSGGFSRAKEEQSQPQISVAQKESEETHLCLGLRLFSRKHPDWYTMRLLNVLLGEGISSRLFQEVRDKKGLTYAIQSDVFSFHDTGALAIYAGTDKRRAEEAVEVILKELFKFKEIGVSEQELHDAKEHYLGKLALDLEDTAYLAEWLGKVLLLKDEIASFDKVLEKINNIKPEDIMRAANTFFLPEKLNLAVIGPLEDAAGLKGQLCLP